MLRRVLWGDHEKRIFAILEIWWEKVSPVQGKKTQANVNPMGLGEGQRGGFEKNETRGKGSPDKWRQCENYMKFVSANT